MLKATTLNNYKEPVKILVYGKPGAGKSTFAKDMAKMKNEDGTNMRIAYVDFENASLGRRAVRDLTDAGVSLKDFLLFHPKEMKDLESLVTALRSDEDFYNYDEDGNETTVIKDSHGNNWRADAFIVDSLSALNQDEQIFFNDISKIRTKIKSKTNGKTRDEKMVDEATAGLELKDRGNIKTNGTKIITNIIRKLDMHCVLIFREKNETETRKTGSGIEIIDTGNKILDSWQFATYEANIVIRLDNDINGSINQYRGIVEKDRTGVFIAGAEIENPTPLMWQDIIYEGENKQSPYSDTQTSDEIIQEKLKKEISKEVDVNEAVLVFIETCKTLDNAKKSALSKQLQENGISVESIQSRTLTEAQAVKLLEVLDNNK